jgi:hypothetical protein
MMLTVEYRAVRRDAVGTEPIAHTDILRLDLEKVPRRVLYLNSVFLSRNTWSDSPIELGFKF